VAALIGYLQWRKSQRAQRELEDHKIQWDKEKLLLQAQFDLEKKHKELELEREQRKEEAEASVHEESRRVAEQAVRFEEQAAAYRMRLVAELKNLRILDMSKPLDLESIYVHVQIQEESNWLSLRDDANDALDHQDGKTRRHHKPTVREPTTVTLPPDEALREFRRIVVLGDPGAGKTTMLRYLAYTTAKRPNESSVPLPIYVELRKFIDSRQDDLIIFVAQDWESRYGFLGAAEYLPQQLDAGRCTLLLDGLDEVLAGATLEEAQTAYDKVSSEVNRLAARYPDVPIAVTCRQAGWRSGLVSFRTLQVLDFDWEQIEGFIGNWYASDPSKGEGLLRTLSANPRMEMLAANPLMLSLIALVYERELELPERRAELYNRCTNVLLKEWDSHRGIKRYSRFTADRKKDLLEEVAWHFHKRGVRYFVKEELLEVVAQYLPTIDISPNDNEAILEEIAAQYGLLKEQAPGRYGFLHLTLQEYFAALAAYERGEEAVHYVVSNRHDSWWEEVLLLLAGRLTDASPMLFEILGLRPASFDPDGGDLVVEDDLFHSDLLVAGRCLIGTPRIRVAGLRTAIVNNLKTRLLSSTLASECNRMATVLVEIGGQDLRTELVNALRGTTPAATHSAQLGISHAIGLHGSQESARQLIDILETERSLDRRLRRPIIHALGTMKASSAYPLLLSLAESKEATPLDASLIWAALYSIDAQRARDGLIDYVLEQLERNLPLSHDLQEAVAVSGDEGTATQLLRLLTRQPQKFHHSQSVEIVQILARLAGPTVVGGFLTMLVEGSVNAETAAALKEALISVRDTTQVPAMLKALENPEVSWEIRWLLTEVLEEFREEAKLPLLELVERPNLDEHVRVGVAVTLSSFGVRSSIQVLRQGIEQSVLPSDIVIGKGFFGRLWGKVWIRMLQLAQKLNDEELQRLLESKIEEAVLIALRESQRTTRRYPMQVVRKPGDDVRDATLGIPPLLLSATLALRDHRSTATARTIIKALRQFQKGETGALALQFESIMVQKDVVKEVGERLLTDLRDRPAKRQHTYVLESIGAVADDVRTLHILLEIYQGLEDQSAGRRRQVLRSQRAEVRNACYLAMYRVSRRARMRVFQNGVIRPDVQPQADDATARRP
jgi:hypothetical protein